MALVIYSSELLGRIRIAYEDSILVEVPDRLDGDHIVSLMERCFTNLSEMKQEEEIKPDTRYRRPRKNEKHYF